MWAWISAEELLNEFDSVLLTVGSTVPRDVKIQGRQFKGVHFAMEFLSQQNKRVAGIDRVVDHRGVKLQQWRDQS